MLANIKRLARHSAIYGLGHILSRGIGFLLLPIYTNYLTPEQYGLFALAFSYLVILNIFYYHGIDSAFLRFYILHDAEHRTEPEVIFSTAFYSLIATGAMLTLAGVLFAETLAGLILDTEGAGPILRYVHLILLLDTAAIIPFLTLRAQEKSVQFGLLKGLNVLVTLGLNVYFIIFLNRGIEGIFLANLYASAFTLLTLLPVLRHSLRFAFSLPVWKELLRFGLPYLPTTLSVVLMDVSDRFILEYFTDDSVVGVYSAGYRLAMIMALMVAAFRFAWHPFFLSTAGEPGAPKLFARIFTYFMLAAAILYLGLFWFLEDFIRIRIGSGYLFGEAYWAGIDLIPILMLAYILFGAYAIFVAGVHISKKTRLLPVFSLLGALVNIIGNMLFIPIWGMYAAAWVTVAGYAVMTASLYFVVQSFYPVPYEFRRVFALVLLVLGYIILTYLLNPLLFGKILLFLSIPFVIYFSNFLREDERSSLRRMLQRAG